MNDRDRRSTFPVPWATEVGVVGFFLTAAALLVLRQEYDPVRRYISEYAVGREGWPLRAGLAFLGLASLNLVPAFIGERGLRGDRRVGGALAVWSVGVLVAAAFPVDLQGRPVTAIGVVHLVASGVSFLALFVAMGLAARSFRRGPGWRPAAGPTRWVAVLTPLAFLLQVSVFASLGWFGVGQWAVLGLAGGWLLLLARHVRRLRRGGAARVH